MEDSATRLTKAANGEPLLIRIPTLTHGRVLLRPSLSESSVALIGFHGYAENAQDQFKRLEELDPQGKLLLCSIQALHPFYTRSRGDVVASWMTRLDREAAIEQNLAYVGSALRDMRRRFPELSGEYFCGFSQGAAMAFRAGVHLSEPPAGVIAVGGDVPPELEKGQLGRLHRVVLVRGKRDRHYGEEQMARDLSRLQGAGVSAETAGFEGGHHWNPETSLIIRGWLDQNLSA